MPLLALPGFSLARPFTGRSESSMFKNRDWRGTAGASVDAIAEIRTVVSVTLPDSYFKFLSASNGGEGPLAVQPWWVCLYSAEEASRLERDKTFYEFFAGLFVIGGNGGGEAIAFDLRRAAPYPLVAFDMANSDLSESIMRLADSFDAFSQLIGREPHAAELET